MTGAALVLRGKADCIPLPDASVDVIVTSPPYFLLRSYRDGGEHYDGQIGSEETPAAYVDSLIACTREWARVLKSSGSMFVNLGDKYAERSGPPRDGFWKGCQDSETYRQAPRPRRRKTEEIQPKSLMGLPWRYALRCIDELDLILRAEILWSKPNGLPESVTDRVRRSHEQVFHFTKEPRYFAAVDEVREAQTGTSHRGRTDGRPPPGGKVERLVATGDHGGQYGGTNPDMFNPLGKLPGSVWSIPSEPLMIPDYFVEDDLGWRMMDRKPLWRYAWHRVTREGFAGPIMVRSIDHFAAFPQELPRRLVLGWSPSGICVECGEGRRPVVAKSLRPDHVQGRAAGAKRSASEPDSNERGMNGAHVNGSTEATITGYACACTPRTSHRGKRGDWKTGRQVMPEHGSDDLHSPGNAVPRRPGGFGDKVPPPETPMIEYHLDGWTPPPTRPAVVLDPFGGTGTTAGVAAALGRIGISLDLSTDYSHLARWRIEQSGHFAKTRDRTNREAQGSLL